VSPRVVVLAGILLLGSALCCAQTFEVGSHDEAKGKPGSPSTKKGQAPADQPLGWGSGLEVAQQARAAQAALAAGDYAAATSHAERAAKAAPQNADLWFLFGYAARLGGHYQTSADAFQHGLAVRPGSIQGVAGLAETYAKMGRHEEALTMVERALPTEVVCAYRIATVQLAWLGRKDEAEGLLLAYLARHPLAGTAVTVTRGRVGGADLLAGGEAGADTVAGVDVAVVDLG